MGAKPLLPLELRPSTPPTTGTDCAGSLGSERVAGGTLNSTKCTKMPPGASGSSTMMARLRAPGGGSLQSSGTDVAVDSQVCAAGMVPSLAKPGELTAIGAGEPLAWAAAAPSVTSAPAASATARRLRVREATRTPMDPPVAAMEY